MVSRRSSPGEAPNIPIIKKKKKKKKKLLAHTLCTQMQIVLNIFGQNLNIF
jgi:hypothetical protein